MKTLKGLALVGSIVVLALAAQGTAASPTPRLSVYTVGPLTVPGVDTGLVLQNGKSVTVTATGTVCLLHGSFCMGPDGDPSYDTINFGVFLLPSAPAGGLVGRVGTGPWVQVGSGPTTLSGSGRLVFAVNDRYSPNNYGDNSGSFKVTVPYTCWPGHGYGDTNHDHTGPPPKNSNPCWPGHGYGDTNHDHSGPPGHDSPGDSSSRGSSSEHGNSGEHGNSSEHGNSGEHGNSSSNGNSNGNGGSKRP